MATLSENLAAAGVLLNGVLFLTSQAKEQELRSKVNKAGTCYYLLITWLLRTCYCLLTTWILRIT